MRASLSGALLAFLLASLLLAAWAPAPASAAQADFVLKDAFWASWSGHGSFNVLCVILRYEGEPEASSIEAELDVSPIWPDGGKVSDSYEGPLRKGQSAAFYFTFLVPDDARASYYILDLEVNYEKGGESATEKLDVYVSLFGIPEIKVSCTSYKLRPSSHNHVELEIANNGSGVARGLLVQVSSPSPYLTIVGSNTFERDLLAPGENWALELDVYVAKGVMGAVYISVAFSFLDQFGNYSRGLVYLGFEVEGKPSLAVSKVICMPPTVFPGDKYVALTVFITNIGDTSAENITLRLEPYQDLIKASYPGSEEVRIPYMPVGYVVNITFLLDVSEEAEPGYYELTLRALHDGLNYTLGLPFTVREKASFEVAKMEFSPEPYPGAKGVRVKIELRNTASVEAKTVRLTIVSAYITGVTSVLIGDMRGGEDRVVVLEVDFDEETPLDLEFEIQISWYQDGRPLMTTLRMSKSLQAPREWPEPREVAVWVGFMGLGMALMFAVLKARKGVF